jgi:hypothetical protein
MCALEAGKRIFNAVKTLYVFVAIVMSLKRSPHAEDNLKVV